MTDAPALTGYFSARTAEWHGSVQYETPDGALVEVTEVTRGKPTSKNDDLVCQGPVTECKKSVPPRQGFGLSDQNPSEILSRDPRPQPIIQEDYPSLRMADPARFGYFSARIAEGTGYSIYGTPDGKEVMVTESAMGEPMFNHDDLVCRGPITEFKKRVPPFDPHSSGGWLQGPLPQITFQDELIGYYSPQIAARSGSMIYTTPNGGLIAVTEVTKGKKGKPVCELEDLVCRGPVSEFKMQSPPISVTRFGRLLGDPLPQSRFQDGFFSMEELRAQRRQKVACERCGGLGTYTCTRCKKARYCGIGCQRQDWREHKPNCARINT